MFEKLLLGLALAQLCALVNAISAAASTALERSNVTLPAWQTFLAYAFIGATFGPMFYARVRGGRAPEYDSGRLGKYAACAFVDVQANYCVTLAFRYTSMTSVSLLDSATIPFAMLLSTLLLKARYGRAHAGGAAPPGELARRLAREGGHEVRARFASIFAKHQCVPPH